MIFSHSKVLIKYLSQKDPSKSIFKRYLFKLYLLIYFTTEFLVGSIFSIKILKSMRRIKLKTKLKAGYLINHKIEHIPYLYDLHNLNEEVDIGKNKIIFDIGAHIGSFSLKYSKNNKIYAFEPNKENYLFLIQNVRDNKLEKNIIIFNFSISNKNGFRKLKLSSGSGGHSFHTISKNYEKVKTIALDEFIKLRKISHVDIIKIDVEGDELNVLIGAKKLLEKMSPVIIVELHPWYISSKKILKKLKEFNYKVNSINGLKIYASKP